MSNLSKSRLHRPITTQLATILIAALVISMTGCVGVRELSNQYPIPRQQRTSDNGNHSGNHYRASSNSKLARSTPVRHETPVCHKRVASNVARKSQSLATPATGKSGSSFRKMPIATAKPNAVRQVAANNHIPRSLPEMKAIRANAVREVIEAEASDARVAKLANLAAQPKNNSSVHRKNMFRPLRSGESGRVQFFVRSRPAKLPIGAVVSDEPTEQPSPKSSLQPIRKTLKQQDKSDGVEAAMIPRVESKIALASNAIPFTIEMDETKTDEEAATKKSSAVRIRVELDQRKSSRRRNR